MGRSFLKAKWLNATCRKPRICCFVPFRLRKSVVGMLPIRMSGRRPGRTVDPESVGLNPSPALTGQLSLGIVPKVSVPWGPPLEHGNDGSCHWAVVRIKQVISKEHLVWKV